MGATRHNPSDSNADRSELMPVLFVGHGTPMNAVEDNPFSRGWRRMGDILPRPTAILCISAHWETWGALVTAMERPRTIHDFGGFPRLLYEMQYPAPGSPWLAHETQQVLQPARVGLDQEWGLDHGCWSVLLKMYPSADIPVVQLGLDESKTPAEQYALARGLFPLRSKGVLIVGSGNMVHNLGRVVWPGGGMADFNRPFGLDWALEASDLFKRLIDEKRHDEMVNYTSLGRAVRLAVPTPEHYLPLLYALALQQEGETVLYLNDQPVAGALTMTSLIIAGGAANEHYARQLTTS